MSDFKGVPTDKLQAQYDAGFDKIRAIRAEIEPIKQELSRRSNARAFVLNQVIAGQEESLRGAGVSEEAIADAKAYVAAEKERKAARRAALATAQTGVGGAQ